MEKRYLLSEAKARFSEVIRAAKAGAKVVLVERTEPIFMLVKYQKQTTTEDLLSDLALSGAITKATQNISDVKPVGRNPKALKDFLEDR